MYERRILHRILLLFVIIVPQIYGSNVPDLSVGMKGDRYYCLLYNDSSDSTVTWDYSDNFPLRYEGPVSLFLEQYNEYFYCYINQPSNVCGHREDNRGTFVSHYWNGPPVLNHLWQEFEYYNLYSFEENSYKINNHYDFQISFSLKIESVTILLCNKLNSCREGVAIRLDGDHSISFEFSCLNGKSGMRLDFVNQTCNRTIPSIVAHKVPVINSKEWHHFSVKLENNTYSVLKYGIKDPIIRHTVNSVTLLEPNQLVLKSDSNTGVFRPHRVNALAYDKSSRAIIKITAPKYCILIFVKTCKNCTVKITVFGDDRIVIFQTLVKQADDWQQIRLKLENAKEKEVLIMATATDTVDKSEDKWYISNTVLRCHSNDLQPIFTNKDGCCYALMYPQHRICTTNLEEYNPGHTKCSADTIGKNCISCKALFNDDCPFDPICDLTPNGTQCSCPAGYYGHYCKERCPDNFFGFDCRQECKKCLSSCDHVRGSCYYGHCENNFTGKYCNISVTPISTNPPIPTVVARRPTSATISVKVTESIDEKIPPRYSLEIKERSLKRWRTVGGAAMKSNNQTFVVENLSPYKTYQLRTVFSMENESLYSGVNVKNVPITILDKFCRNPTLEDLQVDLKNTTFSLLIKGNLSSNECRLDLYTYVLAKEKFSRTGALRRKMSLDGLQPHSQYNFRLLLQDEEVLNVNYTTDMGAPSPPVNITFTRKQRHKLIVHWLHPSHPPHGDISRFHIRINEMEEKVYHVSEQSRAYEYSIDVSNITAQCILVTVSADNNFGKAEASAWTYTPPKAPKFLSHPTRELTNETSVRITLPPVVDQEGSTRIYVVLTDIHQPIASNNDAFFKEYFKEIGVNGAHSGFIAVAESEQFPETVEYNNDRKEIRIFRQYSVIPEGTLKPGHSYKVTIVLNNTFSDYSNCETYHLEFVVPVRLHFLALLLIPTALGAILCAVLSRKFYNKSKNRNSLQSDDVLSVISDVETDEHIYELAAEVVNNLFGQYSNQSVAENSEGKLWDRFSFNALSRIQKRYTKIVNIRDVDQYVKNSIDNGDLARQFQKVSDCPIKPSTCGNAPENKSKNMIPNLAAYDHTRVKLESIYENPISDYINANFINGYAGHNTYIATQGPKSDTINDFWAMIWQQRVEYIIAVCGVFEGSTRKFEKYWPEINGFSTFGEIQVMFTNVEIFANYKIRYFTITYEEMSREIKQIQFCCPIDVGAPQYIRSFVSFSKRILSLNVGESPIVVHGRDGFGRTGILILCDICLRMAVAEGKIDIFNQFYKMRQQRGNMIENVDQYKMVHFILLLTLQCVSVPSQNGISCNNTTMNFEVEDVIATKIEKQLKFLDDSAWQDEGMRCINLNDKRPNIHAKKKLRIQTEYADDFSNASFFPYSYDNPDQVYIRAEVVDSFLIPSRFITTRNPTTSTLGIFWKLIIEKQIKLVISLNKLSPTDTNACIFYPTSNASSINPLPNYRVKFASKQSNTYCDIYYVTITQDDNPYQPTSVIVIQLRKWHQSTLHPEKPNGLMACYESMNDLGKLSGTILVTCRDGIRACGLYVALCYLVDKIQADHICDVCLAVQTVRQSRREFVRPIEQFEFLYRCGLEFVKQFQKYANFDSKIGIN